MTLSSPLPRTTPESQGVSSSAILDFVKAAESTLDSLHSFMLLRHGKVLAEGWWSPYAAEIQRSVFSVSKSFVSSAVGIAIADGVLSLDDRIVDLLPDDVPAEPSDNLKAMQLRHLLTMTSGHAEDTLSPLARSPQYNWAQFILALPVVHEPGTHYVYNSGGTYLVSAILQRLTGERVLDYLTPRLLEPLGITDATWEQDPRGIDCGGWGMNLRTEDIAKLAQLYLQGGAWNGAQLVPAEWVAAATSNLFPTSETQDKPDWAVGYGYQFWQGRHNTYRCDGAFGQLGIVFPDHDVVLALTSGLDETQPLVDLVWEHLLPAFGPTALPEDTTGALAAKLATLELPPQNGAATSPAAAAVSGVTYELDRGSVSLTASTLSLTIDGVAHEFQFGYGSWTRGETAPLYAFSGKYAASGAWTADSTFVARVWFTEGPFEFVITLQFDGASADVQLVQNASFEDVKIVQLHGVPEAPSKG